MKDKGKVAANDAKPGKHEFKRDPAAQATADGQGEPIAAIDPAELEAARKEAQTNLEGWQRTLAEFQNYKRRVDREVKDSYQNASLDFLKSLLPIMDDFERAMSNVPETIANDTWLSGMKLVFRKFQKLLEDNNVTILDPVGQPFDPNLHQAIGAEDSTEVESGHVTTTLQKGYVTGDNKVLRPALVKVAS